MPLLFLWPFASLVITVRLFFIFQCISTVVRGELAYNAGFVPMREHSCYWQVLWQWGMCQGYLGSSSGQWSKQQIIRKQRQEFHRAEKQCLWAKGLFSLKIFYTKYFDLFSAPDPSHLSVHPPTHLCVPPFLSLKQSENQRKRTIRQNNRKQRLCKNEQKNCGDCFH